MIGLFTISAESAVAAGVRRVEALTGPAAFRYLSEGLENLKEIGSILKSKEPVKAVDKLITENAQLIKQVVAPLIKGGGGGQKTLATAGGQDAGKLDEVVIGEDPDHIYHRETGTPFGYKELVVKDIIP